MGLRKASAYSKKKVTPYTRKSSKRNRAYIKAVPPIKIVKYNMGDMQSFLAGKHDYIVKLLANEKALMRDNSLESCRMAINKVLDKEIPGGYYFAIKVYPHHILRENKTAAGAGADRLSSGMKHSFGITIGRAAIVQQGKEIFVVSCTNEKAAQVVKKALSRIKSKIPFNSRIVFQKVR